MGLKFFYPHNPTQPPYDKLLEHLVDYYNENLVDRLDDTKYLGKIENEVNNEVIPYAIGDNQFSIDSCSLLCF